MTGIDAVILAGSTNEGRLRECSPEAFEAMVEIARRPMVSYVFDVLNASRFINRIVVAGPFDEMNGLFGERDNVLIVPGGETAIDSLINALDVLKTKGNVLVATCDIPLLTENSVADFVKRCSRRQADVYYPIIPKEVIERMCPGVKRTYVKFKDGVFTGGNLFLINPAVVKDRAERAKAFVQSRKSPFNLAKLVGWTFLVRFLLHLATLSETEKTVSQIFEMKGAVVISPFPEVGIDVDKPSDLALVREKISQKMQV
ncbi:nucleotidyltransferase family protein [Candidatus Formimonas warabiya]|uniref:nucleotidyltransferase family protein n=1 Tax=Formimonas warabiya TaxID=1761012 RepID=UPI001F238C4C|nr:nucleotidyltransferase family protein [Candidatus Formimonas warabiya]